MMIVSTWRKRTARMVAALGFGLLAILVATGLDGYPLASLRQIQIAPPGLDDVASSVHFNAQLRAWLELAVVLLQVVAVATLCLSRFLPSTGWADRGRLGFVVSMVGLG